MKPKPAEKLVKTGGQGDGVALLESRGHHRSDARMLRRLIRNPIYVPNAYFREAAGKLWHIANNAKEERVKVVAIKTINDICKVNLLVRERQSDKPNINLHLHKHEHATASLDKLSEDELLQLKALMEKAGLSS